MCGIAGVLHFDQSTPVDLDRLTAMSTAIAHRGPDGCGQFVAPGIGLAHRRLSIIDLAGGSQPLGNEGGSIQVVFNGEIYNYLELRRELESKGHKFRTRSDTEVLVHLYEELGERLVDRLRGMFAFALWDAPRRRLLLARDRLGIKPLYYVRTEDELLFCSELKGILAYDGMARDVDPAALEDYLAFGFVPGERSIFRSIRKLLPGHTLTIDDRRWHRAPTRYWELSFATDDSLSEQQWGERIRAKLNDAVGSHLVADVPVGAFLSGGIDSSVVTAIASSMTDRRLQTFSIGFREARFNELPYARQVAERYGTDHVEEFATPEAASLLEELCWHYDEPFADTSAIPTMLVARLASRHAKVVLSGDGGDEAFGGYARYQHDLTEAALRSWLPRSLRHRLLGPLGRAWPYADWLPRPLRLKNLLTNLSLDDGDAYANTIAQCRLPLRRELLSPDMRRELSQHRPEHLASEAYRRGADDPLHSMIAADVATLLPDDYLVKVDRASMAYGLEVRPPLLDHELLELAARVPSRLKVRHGEGKWILKQACRDLLPGDLRSRPKQGFEIPVDAWLRGDLRDMFHDLVLDKQRAAARYLDLAAVRQAFEQHLSGRRRLGQVLWSVMVFAQWSETFLRGSATVQREKVLL
jgi:asparagine synthase (glutamine-hydrolysing)